MKKLLSLALVLTMLFTIIAVPSVSAAIYKETNIAAANFTGLTVRKDSETNNYFYGFTAEGTDADVSKNTGKAGSRLTVNTGATVTSDNKTYTSVYTAEATTSTAAGIAEGIGADVPILKYTQTANTNIFRWYFADGAIDAADTENGETIEYRFKLYLTDFYSSSPYLDTTTSEEVPGVKIANPETFSWKLGPMTSSGGRGNAKSTAVATGKWVDVTIVNNTLTDVAGVCMEGYGSGTKADNYTQIYPGTIYIAAPSIVRVTPVASNQVAVTKLGEGTVTGAGDVVTGETATLTATPAEGYHFAGWYEKGADQSAANLLSANATYAFTVTADTNVVAVFEKDAVNNWIELSRITFTNDLPANTNLWSKNASWENVNSVQAATTYTDAEITAPDTSCGDGVLKIDSSLQTDSAYGMVDGRIGYIPGYKVRFEEGKKYRVSCWIYIAETAKEKEAGEEMTFIWGPYKNSSTVTKGDTVKVGEWVKLSREFTADASWANAYTGLRLSPANITAADKEKYYDNAALTDSIILGYVDEVVFEKFDAVTVSAEATNGVVYGAGEYKKGDQATLIAAGNTGYVFEGYYVGDECVSTNAKYTFTVEGDITVEAKFVERAEATFPENNLYHWGAETGELGSYNSWYKWVGQEDPSDNKADGAGVITWAQAAELGVEVPSADPTFGDKLYADNFANSAKTILATVDGRMRGWENGKIVNKATVTEKTEASGRYIEGKQYKFTWWVYPKSMRVVDDTDTYVKNNQTRLKITHNDGQNTGITTTQTLNVGEWNKIEWVFTANAKSALYAPGIYYQWQSSGTADSEGKKNIVNCAFYDNIQVEEITSWQFGDTKTPTGWVARGGKTGMDTAFHGTAKDNCSIMHVETYDQIGVGKASADAGDHLFVFDTARPNAPEANYNPTEGSIFWPEGEDPMSYEDAYALYSSYETITGDLAGRFNTIASAGSLTIGKTYKISLKVYIDEIRNLKEEGCPVVADATNKVVITGTNTGSKPVGDGKQVSKVVDQDTWTEISYTFKATEAGAAYAPSLRIDFVVADHTEFPTLVYVDDVKVERVYVDDLDLVIEDGETEVTATATVYDIKSGDTINAIVIIAGYDVDGKLVSVSFSNGGESKPLAVGDTLDAAYTKADGIDSYVAFLWNDLTNIRPYVLPVPLSTEVTE